MTDKTAWAHLPNAKHIDAVLADVQKRPEAWDAAADKAWIDTTFEKQARRDAEREAAWRTSRDAICAAKRADVMSAVCDGIEAMKTNNVFAVATDSTDALIAWDKPPVCHQAALLLPYAIVRFGQ